MIGIGGGRSIGLGLGLGTARAGGAALWYRAGGAPLPVAAYQPIGAASLAASYVNLANPGTYDAAPGVAPTWASATGWGFNGFTQYLKSGVIPENNQTWAMLVRIANGVSPSGIRVIAGSRGALPEYYFEVWHGDANVIYYGNGAEKAGSASITSGVLGVAGTTGYKNGNVDCTAIGTQGTNAAAIYLGGFNQNGSTQYLFSGNILAVAIWNTSTGHATWMPAVSAAAAALTG
jgi:hypothetical protein